MERVLPNMKVLSDFLRRAKLHLLFLWHNAGDRSLIYVAYLGLLSITGAYILA